MEIYLGIDVGSVTTKLVAIDKDDRMVASVYLPTCGQPVTAVQQGLGRIEAQLPPDSEIRGAATTGSARELAGALVGADLIKNEITCQAVAAIHHNHEVRTVIEIGGQDSKIIIVRNGIVTDFGMNTVCAAGTGSFLDHQASRLKMSIEEFSRKALEAETPVHIVGRCTVFAESDMINKQQAGSPTEGIIYGLCQALVSNYLSDVASGKEIQSPVVFQGGVAFNHGIIRALREELHIDIVVPPHPESMGAVGAALLVHEFMADDSNKTRFKGFRIGDLECRTSSFECRACPSQCDIVQVSAEGQKLTCRGGRCEMWAESSPGKGG